MNAIAMADVDRSIDRVVGGLVNVEGESVIQKLYPNQRRLLHEFCQGRDIFYTGNIWIQVKTKYIKIQILNF